MHHIIVSEPLLYMIVCNLNILPEIFQDLMTQRIYCIVEGFQAVKIERPMFRLVKKALKDLLFELKQGIS